MSNHYECMSCEQTIYQDVDHICPSNKVPINIPHVPEDAVLADENGAFDGLCGRGCEEPCGEAFGFQVKDSGERQQFSSGMVRDVQTNKPDISRVFDGPMLARWAEHITKGATKYPDIAPGVPNWMLANGLEELNRFKKSAARHFYQWMKGDTDEDHAAATLFNINGYEYVRGRLHDK